MNSEHKKVIPIALAVFNIFQSPHSHLTSGFPFAVPLSDFWDSMIMLLFIFRPYKWNSRRGRGENRIWLSSF